MRYIQTLYHTFLHLSGPGAGYSLERKTIMKEERQGGQSIILVAIMALGLVALAAMAVDLSNAYFFRRTAQNAADAAALAGAEELAWQRNKHGKNLENKNGTARDINSTVNELAERNGVEDTDPDETYINDNVEAFYLDINGNHLSEDPIPVAIQDSTPNDAFGIEAVTYMTAPTFLGGVLGWDGYPVSAVAAVSVRAPVCGVSCVVPIATYWNVSSTWGVTRTYETSDVPNWFEHTEWITTSDTPFKCYNIWNGDGPGNFGWLQWELQNIFCDTDDCGEQCLGDNLNPDECIGKLGIGEWVAGGPGTVNGDYVRDQLNRWISSPGALVDNDESTWPKAFTVPVFTTTANLGGCNQAYLVSGFGRMQLIGYQLSQGGGTNVEQDPWVDPSVCTDVYDPFGEGEEPNKGRRLTAIFYDLILEDALTGSCEPYGTISTIRLTK
jgi:hypothetical protein